jgi:hypothetical protein
MKSEAEHERDEDWAFWATEQAERIAADEIDTKDLGDLVVEHSEGALLGILLDALQYEQGPEAVAAAFKDLKDGVKSSIEAAVFHNLEAEHERRKSAEALHRNYGGMRPDDREAA